MAYAQFRSANRELETGMVDGKYKQIVKDRGGVVEGTTWATRADLDCKYYGLHEAPVMAAPDGQSCVPVDHVATATHDDHAMSGVMMYG